MSVEIIRDLLSWLKPVYGTIAGIAAAAGLVARWWNSRTIRTGLYVATWTDHDKDRVRVEMIAVRRRFRGVLLVPLLRPACKGTYKIALNYSPGDIKVLSGPWSKPNRNGLVQVTHHEHERILAGRWLGPDRESNVRSGDWFCRHRRALTLGDRFRLGGAGIADAAERVVAIGRAPDGPMNDVIRRTRAATQADDRFEIGGLSLRVPVGVFNPRFGSISEKLLAEAIRHCRPDSRVLDLGTGSGYFAVSLARSIGCRVTAVDCDGQAIRAARENARHHGVEHLCTFHQSDEDELFGWASFGTEFDLILANLPFSRASHARGLEDPSYEKAFIGSRRLLTRLLFESLSFVGPGGILLMSHGRSGYVEHLQWLLETLPWSVQTVDEVKGAFDTTSVLRLDLSDHFQALASSVDTMSIDDGSRLMLGWRPALPAPPAGPPG